MTRRSYQIKAEHARNERWRSIQIRLTPDEYETLAADARSRGLSVSGLARALCLIVVDRAGKP